jgi:hypothetical protein
VRPSCTVNWWTGSCDGARLRLSTAASRPAVLSPYKNECDRVSERDRLGLTPNLTTSGEVGDGRGGNENSLYSSLWDLKSFLHAVISYEIVPFRFTSHPQERKKDQVKFFGSTTWRTQNISVTVWNVYPGTKA